MTKIFVEMMLNTESSIKNWKVKLMNLYDGMINSSITKGKIIFWDIDGVLASYRFNNHVGVDDGTHNGMSKEEVDNGCFLYRKPSKHMQKVLNTSGAKKNIIMGHCGYYQEILDKKKWLKEYYPMIDDIILTYQDIPKYKSIIDYCSKNQILLKDILFVDDTVPYLQMAERQGISSWHISSFLDWE